MNHVNQQSSGSLERHAWAGWQLSQTINPVIFYFYLLITVPKPNNTICYWVEDLTAISIDLSPRYICLIVSEEVLLLWHINSCLLLIIGVWLDDEGSYICEANNPFGTIKTEARVSVTGLGMFLRNLWQSTATGFLKYILVHLVFMASRLHSAALVKSVRLIFL